MLYKSRAAEQAIEKKDHKTTKSLIQKALIFAAILVLIYIIWSYSLINESLVYKNKQLKRHSEFNSGYTQAQPSKVDLFAQNAQYVRFGLPASKYRKDSDYAFDSKFQVLKSQLKLTESEKLMRKSLRDREISEKFSAFYALPTELPLYILIGLISLYLAVKLSVYFISFNNYSKALEQQEYLNGVIMYLNAIKPNEVPKVRVVEEKEDAKQSKVVSTDEPMIEDEQFEIPYSFNSDINDYKIHENVMAYPIPSEFTTEKV